MKNREISNTDLVIKFPNEEAREYFASWLCNFGEQCYWDWMEAQEDENKENITATKFHYHGEEDKTKETSDPSRYNKFMNDGIIRTTMGRVTK